MAGCRYILSADRVGEEGAIGLASSARQGPIVREVDQLRADHAAASACPTVTAHGIYRDGSARTVTATWTLKPRRVCSPEWRADGRRGAWPGLPQMQVPRMPMSLWESSPLLADTGEDAKDTSKTAMSAVTIRRCFNTSVSPSEKLIRLTKPSLHAGEGLNASQPGAGRSRQDVSIEMENRRNDGWSWKRFLNQVSNPSIVAAVPIGGASWLRGGWFAMKQRGDHADLFHTNRSRPYAAAGWLDDLRAGRPKALADWSDLLRSYYRHAVESAWVSVSAAVDGDLAARRAALHTGGVHALLDSYRPLMRWQYPVLELPGHPSGRDVYLQGRGLRLIPSFFCRLHPLTIYDDQLPQDRMPPGCTIPGCSHGYSARPAPRC